jgi:hypothetical protein
VAVTSNFVSTKAVFLSLITTNKKEETRKNKQIIGESRMESFLTVLGMFRALWHVSMNKIIHRDIKPVR